MIKAMVFNYIFPPFFGSTPYLFCKMKSGGLEPSVKLGSATPRNICGVTFSLLNL